MELNINNSCSFFFYKTVPITIIIFNSKLPHHLKSFKHVHFFIYVDTCPVNIHWAILTTQTDLSLTYKSLL